MVCCEAGCDSVSLIEQTLCCVEAIVPNLQNDKSCKEMNLATLRLMAHLVESWIALQIFLCPSSSDLMLVCSECSRSIPKTWSHASVSFDSRGRHEPRFQELLQPELVRSRQSAGLTKVCGKRQSTKVRNASAVVAPFLFPISFRE